MAIEIVDFPLKMVIFHSYVSLPEGQIWEPNMAIEQAVPSGKLTYIDPENHHFWVETNLPTPMTGRVYVNLLEGHIAIEHLLFIPIKDGDFHSYV